VPKEGLACRLRGKKWQGTEQKESDQKSFQGKMVTELLSSYAPEGRFSPAERGFGGEEGVHFLGDEN